MRIAVTLGDPNGIGPEIAIKAALHFARDPKIKLLLVGDGFVIDRIALTMQATVPGVDDAKFQEIAAAAKRDCPLSKALASVPEITLQATLR